MHYRIFSFPGFYPLDVKQCHPQPSPRTPVSYDNQKSLWILSPGEGEITLVENHCHGWTSH